jgi:putative membrane protein
MWYVHEGMGWWMVFGGILMILFWGGIITLIVWGVRRLTRHSGVSGATGNPLEIAKERYAKGDITKKEYEQIKKDLSS